MDFIEQPLFLAVVSIIGGIVAVTVYPPIFVLSVICILLALHRSKALAGLRPVVQVAWYILVFVLSTAILVWVGREVRGSARAFMRDLAAAVVQAIKPQLPTAPDPASKSGNNLQLPTAAQIAEEVTKRLPTTNTAPKVELPLAVEFHIASPKIITVLNHGREIQDVRLRLTEYGYAAEAPWSDIPATKDKPAIIHKPPKRVTFYQLCIAPL